MGDKTVKVIGEADCGKLQSPPSQDDYNCHGSHLNKAFGQEKEAMGVCVFTVKAGGTGVWQVACPET